MLRHITKPPYPLLHTMPSITCHQCAQQFNTTSLEERLREKLAPEINGEKLLFCVPTLCPECRHQRRLAYRNERSLYTRKCDMTGETIISIYSPDKPYKVYGHDAWWSDRWDGRDYGKEFDFTRPFFDQMNELLLEVPRPNTVNMFSENSLYSNHAAYNKNCYMVVNIGWCEDCLYISNYCIKDKDCVDCLAVRESEQCYMSVNTTKASYSQYLLDCDTCSDCYFCYDCRGCQNCFGCHNLRQKQYCIYNKQYSKEEYQAKLAEVMPKTRVDYDRAFENFKKRMAEEAIHKAVTVYNCENATGDYLRNCKNVQDVYYSFDSEDLCYCYDGAEMKDCVDITEPFTGEMHYETHACNMLYRGVSCSKCYEDNDIYYCQYCWNSNNLSGCVGLKRNAFCILNKQYTEEEYKSLLPKIIKHMTKTGEWGEFFATADSPYGYNEVTANEYFPLTKDEALAKGFKWNEYEATLPDVTSKLTKDDLPQTAAELTDESMKSVLEAAIVCSRTGRLFRYIAPEIAFYRQNNIPLPHLHPDERHKERFELRNQRHLWDRACDKCGRHIQSTYPPDRPETIYCEECYNSEIY